MKLNKKGISIIELIVSISLISVVMLFMYRLLANVTFQKEDDFFASVNQEQRIEIIDKIETAIEKALDTYTGTVTVGKISGSGFHGIDVRIGSSSRVQIRVKTNNYKNIILYEANPSLSITNQWTIKGGTLANSTNTVLNKKLDSTYNTGYDMYEISIPVYTTNTNNKKYSHNSKTIDNNNTIDDIIFSVIVKK